MCEIQIHSAANACAAVHVRLVGALRGAQESERALHIQDPGVPDNGDARGHAHPRVHALQFRDGVCAVRADPGLAAAEPPDKADLRGQRPHLHSEHLRHPVLQERDQPSRTQHPTCDLPVRVLPADLPD